MDISKKLYRLTSDGFRYPWSVWKEEVNFKPGENIPLLFWPDGSVCWLANLYLLKGYKDGKSRRNNGGTLLTYAKNLSPFIRWCYENELDFFDLEEPDFVSFVTDLRDETAKNAPTKSVRGLKQVNTIAGAVMNFLAFVDGIMPGLGLLGSNGKIKAELKSIELKKRGKTIYVKKWTHHCLPRDNPTRRRQPISTDAIDKLHNANDSSSESGFVKRRRYVMLRLFEITGGRRIEASLVKINDLLEAERTGLLRIFSAKQGDDEAVRFVPVPKVDLKDILSFVKIYRNPIVRKTIGIANDHGYLFINSKNGKHLQVDTLGSELYEIRIAAGIDDEEVCLHAFRHRYVTEQLRRLIRTQRCESVSDLKKALLSMESLKQQLMEWTGHSNMESLDWYIHHAFETETGFRESLDILQASKVVESLHFIIKDYQNQAQAGGWSPQLFKEFESVVATAALELSQLFAAQRVGEVTPLKVYES
ncbi:site-specific integrase [Massilia forsythiae]|uniref:Site-specific integrase n=1 Tax=Massilia forsythiae TaxID=2728020 RepID=A0A7Z2ZTB9_9BURK|nr:site-specific integrase [Massilia forsythiae]QJD99831.1 site-specific integrase [Massilia forsythiae]